MRYLILGLVFFIQCIHAKPLSLDKPLEYIGEHTSFYVDKKGEKKLNDILNLPNNAFEKVASKADSRLFTQDTLWYKFKVENRQNKTLERYIIFDIPWLDDIQIYIQSHDQLQHYVLGNNLAFEKRSLKTHFINIKSEFEPGISNVYMKVKTQDPFIVPISILDEKSINNKLHNNELFHIMLYTLITVMIVFNLILYLVIKERTYLYYALFLFAFELMITSYNNLTYEFLWSNSPLFQDWAQSTAIYLYSIFGLIFVQSFLSLEKLFPHIYKLHKIIFTLFIAVAILSIPFGYHYHVMFSIVLTIVFSLYTFSVALYSLLNGNSYAKFFLLGTFAGMIGTSLTALSAMSFLEYDEILYNAVDYGMMIDAILISVALAKKYKVLFEKVESVNQELFVLNNTLEDQVSERTNQLQQEITKKNLLFKEIFHRVKNNMQIISSLFMLQQNKIEDEKAQVIISDNVSRIKIMSILHEKLYKNDNIDKGDFKNYLEEIVPTIVQSLSSSAISYKIHCKPLILTSDDLISFGLIFNEFITNSLKYGFTNTGKTEILIDIKDKDENIIIIYKDNGKGLKANNTEGFGSKLIKSIVEYQMNGTIKYIDTKGFECRMQFPKKNLVT